MTPQERDLITNLLSRLKAQSGQAKDAEAEALIRQAVGELSDASYLLVQTVLIQDMALNAAQSRLSDLERQLAAAKAAPAAQPTTSFLGGAGQGSVPSTGPWARSAQPQEPPAAAPRTVWTQSASPAPMTQPAAGAMMGQTPLMPGTGGGFLRQAATTAAGIAGGALLFQGIQSLFGPHYGGGFLAGTPMQPGTSETVINNYYDHPAGPELRQADAGNRDDGDTGFASDPGQDYAADQDFGAQDFANDDTGYDDV